MKLFSLLTLIFCTSAAFAAEVATIDAATETSKLPKKSATKKKKVAASPSNPKIPTRLPEYKGKKKIQVDFESNSGSHTTTVIVRQPLPLEKALNTAEEENSVAVQSLAQPTPLAPKPAPPLLSFLTPAPTPAPVMSAPIEVLTVRERPRPQPTPTPPPPIAIVETIRPAAAPLPPPESSTISAEKTFNSKYRAAPAAPSFSSEATRLYVRTAFLSAHYSNYASELQDGATSFGLGLAHQFSSIEGRALIEVGHGLDQEVSAQNIRYLLVRADASYLFLPGAFTPIAGAGLGYGSANLRSYRASEGNTLTIREHAKATTLILTPAAGLRYATDSNFTIDLTAEYLAFVGGGNSGDLGGLAYALAIGIPF